MWNFVFVVCLLLLVYILFFFLFCIYGLIKKIHVFPSSKQKTNFAVLLPVRNEEAVLQNLLDSLNAQNYPKDRFHIYTIINNSTDRSEEIALLNQCTVIKPDIPIHSKGQALQYAFETLKNNREIDAYVIFDTDNVVDENFLDKMNDAYQSGYECAQGRRISKNQTPNSLSQCYEIFYTFQNVYFNHARFSAGKSASLNGTGWMIAKQWIDTNGFESKTITEDLECLAFLTKTDAKTAYVHDAVTYDEYPDSLRIAVRQLRRWIFGQVQCGRFYTKQLLTQYFHHPSISTVDALLIYNMTYFVELLLIMLVSILVFTPTHPLLLFIHRYFLPCLLFVYLFAVLLALLGIRKIGYSVKKNIHGILQFPLFILLWLPLLFSVQFKKDFEWSQIEHHNETTIAEVK